jgi:hypothetical protein
MKSSTPVFLGAWHCASGNACTVTFSRDENGLEHLAFAWDVFPLPVADHVWYIAKILPAVTTRLAEYKETPVVPRESIVSVLVL